MDAVDISLLTCGPGSEVWSLYGHTAIRYQNHDKKTDVAVNYGAFSFEQDYFVPRFVFGLTDYCMDIMPMHVFLQEYKREGRWVVQQDLNLTREEKAAITLALEQNSLPENRDYRYNFFYDNCTTRAMQMIINHLNTNGYKCDNQWEGESYRTMIHQWNEHHRWSRFGNDLLLGIKSDFKTEKEASYFLPDSLRKHFDSIILTNPDGTTRKLVSKESFLISKQKNGETITLELFLLTPATLFGFLFVFVFLISLLQFYTKGNYWLLDLVLLLASGLAGLILLAMVFSQHPTVSINLQILVLNPLNLLFLYPLIKSERKQQLHRYWICLFFCMIVFLIGGFWQSYAEGMNFVALCLLIRFIANKRVLKK
ncbi:MAG: DUF4105 domain-containing protein [Prevotella sp.]|nr:DUF4105 domain-containing protein [Prevotella sp.]